MRSKSARTRGVKAARMLLTLLALGLGASVATCADAATIGLLSHPLITRPASDNDRVSIPGNVSPFATAANDRGRVDDGTLLEHMQLLLQRPADREQALQQLMKEQLTAGSPNYHKWLTAEQLAEQYGVSQLDIDAISGWLTSHGLTVNKVLDGGTLIDFTGTAGQVRQAFGTEIHRLSVGGSNHIANMSDPEIPAAFAAVVKGVVSLNDFRPHTNFKPKPHSNYTFTEDGSTYEAVVPADLATIYNLNPLFNGTTTGSDVTGTGQTIVLIEDTNVYSTADITTFRSTFGLPTATFSQVQPGGCTNPGDVVGNDAEAELDVEYAGAAAPGATLELASCADTSTTFGGLIALENLIDQSTLPQIVSISYGECEAENGATQNAAYSSTYENAGAEGISVFVSSGDEGAASCDADEDYASHGIAVSGFASTPYNVAVGGTDFGDTYAGTNSTYWNTTNTSTYGSAKSYIPEIPWNDSCASELISSKEGYSTTYGSSGFCNSSTGKADFLTTASGSGGPSGCATGTPSKSGEVSGTCAGYAKPSWQSIVGNPADGVRDIPDVSLFAANGVWGHYYVFCYSRTSDDAGGYACTGAPSGWSGAGGTSFASPIMAGIQALVNQAGGYTTGVGLPVAQYYKLAVAEYGTTGSTACNSSDVTATSCVFYDVTQGDMDVVSKKSAPNTYLPSGTYGVLSTSTSAYDPAYTTGTGWDFATGIGSVNAANLVTAWLANP